MNLMTSVLISDRGWFTGSRYQGLESVEVFFPPWFPPVLNSACGRVWVKEKGCF